MKDIGRVELGAKNQDVDVRFDGKETVFLAIFQLPDANALETYDRALAKMHELEKGFPEGVDWEVAFDQTPYTRESIHEVFNALRDAVILVADRRAGVLAELAVVDHSAGGRAGGDRRHVRRDGGVRLQPEQLDACSGWCWPSASSSTTRSWWSKRSSITSSMGWRRAKRRSRPWSRSRGR